MTILMYHQIATLAASQDPVGLAISPARFERQVRYLHHAGFRCTSLAERLAGGDQPPRKTIVLTFDDGFQDFYTTVWPILDQYEFTATVFPVVNCIGEHSNWAGQAGELSAPLLSWNQLDELVRNGFEVGSHTLTHPRLSTLSHEQIVCELEQSKQALEDRLGRECRFFSYPYSDRSPAIQQLVAEIGYRAACAGDRGPWGPFNLWRVQCWRHEGQLKFVLKANGWHERAIWLREQTSLGHLIRRLVRASRQLGSARPLATRQ